MNEFEALSSRIEELERKARWSRRLNTVLLVGLGSLVVVAFQQPTQESLQAKIVQAREFRLVDEKGAIRGTFGPDDDTPSAVSLTIRPNGIDEMVRLLGGPERSELILDGSDECGAIWLGASEGRTDLALLIPGGGTKTAVVSLGARDLAGSLVVSKMENIEVQGGPGVRTLNSFRWPERADGQAK